MGEGGLLESRASRKSPETTGRLFGLLIRKSFEMIVALQTARFFRSAIRAGAPRHVQHARQLGFLCTPVFHRTANVRLPISAMLTLRQLECRIWLISRTSDLFLRRFVAQSRERDGASQRQRTNC